MVKLATSIRSNVDCGLRSVVKILELVNEAFGGILGDKLSSHTTISDWMQKNGMSPYMEAGMGLSAGDYCEILDESITVGSQKLILTLGAAATSPGHPLSHTDVEVLGMAVAPSWNGDSVEKEIGKSIAKVGHAPSYIISDNAPNLAKGIRQAGITHHRDIGHSFGLILEEVYKGQEDFEGFMQKMNGIRTKYHLTKMAYLLPPKQRAIARFMNLFSLVEWAAGMWMGSVVLLRCQQLTVAAFLELDHVGLAISGGGHNHFLRNLHITLVIAANFSNNLWCFHSR